MDADAYADASDLSASASAAPSSLARTLVGAASVSLRALLADGYEPLAEPLACAVCCVAKWVQPVAPAEVALGPTD